MSCTMDEIVIKAKSRGYQTKYKIDSKNNAQYAVLTKDGNPIDIRYEEKDRAGGVRTHVGSLMKEFPFEVEEFLDWFEEQLKNRNKDAKIAEFIEPRL